MLSNDKSELLEPRITLSNAFEFMRASQASQLQITADNQAKVYNQANMLHQAIAYPTRHGGATNRSLSAISPLLDERICSPARDLILDTDTVAAKSASLLSTSCNFYLE